MPENVTVRFASRNIETPPEWVKELKKRELNGVQKSTEWLIQREKMLTASDAASAVDENPYSSQAELIERKCSNTCGAFTGNYISNTTTARHTTKTSTCCSLLVQAFKVNNEREANY